MPTFEAGVHLAGVSLVHRRSTMRSHALVVWVVVVWVVACSLLTARVSLAQGCAADWVPEFAGAGTTLDYATAAEVFDDGSGPALHVGGMFTTAGVSRWRVARWNGSDWEPLGADMGNAWHFSLAVFDDGSGPALYAGWTMGSGTGVDTVARWDGASWQPLGSGDIGEVWALEVFDDGSGPALYAGGSFHLSRGDVADRIARWDGESWTPVGGGTSAIVQALAVHDDGSGPALYAGGAFLEAGGVPAQFVARWDGASWSALGAGRNNPVTALLSSPGTGASAPVLYAASLGVGAWDGQSWTTIGTMGFSGAEALAIFDDGAGGGPALYSGGPFTSAGGVPANHVTRFDGSTWHPLGAGVESTVHDLCVFDAGDGAGPALYVVGEFNGSPAGDAGVARWQGCPDDEPPVISGPSAIRVLDSFPAPAGRAVHFTVGVQDRDPRATLVCAPPSGSFFPLGTTLVQCTATDASGNTSTHTFPVTVERKARRP
jgi:HYR domain-containing protein